MNPTLKRINETAVKVDKIIHDSGLTVQEAVVVACMLLVKAQPLSGVSRDEFLKRVNWYVDSELHDGGAN